MIDIVCADASMLRHVLRRLRAADEHELDACGVNRTSLVPAIMKQYVFAYCACCIEGGPIACWGMLHVRQGVGAGFAFGTIRWGEAVLPMVRQIRTFVLPYLRDAGYHRVEARALASRLDVARFMALIDAQPEGVMQGMGCNGEDFVSYRWLDEHRGEKRSTSPVLHSHTAH